MALHFNATMPDPMQHTIPHISLPTTTPRFFPGLPCPQTWTQTSTLGRSWRDEVEAEWTHLQMSVSCFRHSSWSGWPSRRQWFTTWSSPCLWDAEQLFFFLKEGTPPTDVRVLSHKTLSDRTSSWKRRVLKSWAWLESIAKWNLINLIFCWIFAHQFTCQTNQICVSFFGTVFIYLFLRLLYSWLPSVLI